VHTHERQVVGHRKQDALPRQPGRAGEHRRADRTHQDDARNDPRTGSQALGTFLRFCPIIATKSATRGPHRDAMSSSSGTTAPFFTALMPENPGRAASVCWFWLQHRASARKITSGLAFTTYSADSCG